MKAVVVGCGPSGVCTALALSRDGHDVTLVERDAFTAPEAWPDAFEWQRRGIAHFHQPHGFLPRGTNELREHLPDVYERLLGAGATPMSYARNVPGGPPPEGPGLDALAVRRPVIEWALRRAIIEEPRISVADGCAATGLAGGGGRVTGIRTARGVIEADLVVDALGRKSPVPEWIVRDAGGRHVVEESASCEVLFYARYYRLRSGCELPEGPWIVSPRSDLGYAGLATFPGDNGTFAVNVGIPASDPDLRELKREEAFETLVAAATPVNRWCNPELAEPITGVLSMGNVHNTLRRFVVDGDPVARGIVPSGDSYCHTNPMFALGLSFALIHAFALRDAIREHGNDVEAAYTASTIGEVRERFDAAVQFDGARTRRWNGEPLNPLRRDGSLPLFLAVAPGIAGLVDRAAGLAHARRTGFIAPVSELEDDAELLATIEATVASMMEKAPPPPPVPRDELLERMRAAV